MPRLLASGRIVASLLAVCWRSSSAAVSRSDAEPSAAGLGEESQRCPEYSSIGGELSHHGGRERGCSTRRSRGSSRAAKFTPLLEQQHSPPPPASFFCATASLDGSGVSLVQLSRGRLGIVPSVAGQQAHNDSLRLPALPNAPLPKAVLSDVLGAGLSHGERRGGPATEGDDVSGGSMAWPSVFLRELWRYISFIGMQLQTDARCFLPVFLVISGLIVSIILVFIAYSHLNEGLEGEDFIDGSSKKSGFLCKELIVPEGCECIFAMPSLKGREALGQFRILDKTGRALLHASVERFPPPTHSSGGSVATGSSERVTLAGSDGRAFAFCRVALPDGEGSSPCAFIYRPGGELFARLGEAPVSAGGIWSHFISRDAFGVPKSCQGSAADAPPRFALWSSILGDWQMHFHGDVAKRRLNVTDQRLQLVATAEPGDFGFDHSGEEYYLLHLAAQSDAGLLLCSLLALDRLAAHWPQAPDEENGAEAPSPT